VQAWQWGAAGMAAHYRQTNGGNGKNDKKKPLKVGHLRNFF